MADDRHRPSVKTGDAAQNGRVFFALTVAALLKEIGEQCVHDLIDVGAFRMPGQKHPVLGGQRAAGAQDLVLLHGQLSQFGRMSRDGFHVIAAALQRGDLGVQRSQLFQNFFDHSCFPPVWSCKIWIKVSRSWLRGIT